MDLDSLFLPRFDVDPFECLQCLNRTFRIVGVLHVDLSDLVAVTLALVRDLECQGYLLVGLDLVLDNRASLYSNVV